jgi:hypothetical protein
MVVWWLRYGHLRGSVHQCEGRFAPSRTSAQPAGRNCSLLPVGGSELRRQPGRSLLVLEQRGQLDQILDAGTAAFDCPQHLRPALLAAIRVGEVALAVAGLSSAGAAAPWTTRHDAVPRRVCAV